MKAVTKNLECFINELANTLSGTHDHYNQETLHTVMCIDACIYLLYTDLIASQRWLDLAQWNCSCIVFTCALAKTFQYCIGINYM